MTPKKHYVLCSKCDACPAIEVYDDEVRIGEEGDVVRLTRDQWNDLVEKIRQGELSQI